MGRRALGQQHGDGSFFSVILFSDYFECFFLSNDFISHIGMKEWGCEAWGWELISGILFSDNYEIFLLIK